MKSNLFNDIYNPDVLSCLANLSNDEVFTPPDIVNQMLDMLPEHLFKDPRTTFLDPACKSGVFLREIAKRLIDGLVPIIPDLQERIDHIFQNQLYGIAITELTSLLSRRSVYCSKYSNSIYSICRFDDTAGNIRFKSVKHKWDGGKCVFCGASKSEYDRDESLETHAYELIHTLRPKEIFNMKFDVIIGNPPYQLNDGGGTGSSAIPIYQQFVQQAQKLNPRYLTMIIPSRWFTGGRGLDSFRNDMLQDKRLRILHDFPNANDCFPGVEIKGGVCYFLWDRDSLGMCNVVTHKEDEIVSQMERYLLDEDQSVFIRDNFAINILRKVQSLNEKSFSEIVSANDPFGFDVRMKNSYRRIKPDYKLKSMSDGVNYYYNGWRKDGIGYIKRSNINKNKEWIDTYKVLIPKAWGTGETSKDKLSPFIVEPGSCCTETYLVVGPLNDMETCENVVSYITTKFFHFMVSMIKITQNTMQKAYTYVPLQDFETKWTDQELYQKYQLSKEEIEYIENLVPDLNE